MRDVFEASRPVGGSSGALLSARGLSRRFRHSGRTIEVLRDASIDVADGEFVAIVGRSGVGKSTLLHILGALDRPDGGSLVYKEQDVFAAGALARDRFRNQEVGFVFQFHHLLPEFTAIENVMMPVRIAGRSAGDAGAMAGRILEQLGLGERLQHRPQELSGGEQQRVAVARALVNEPALLLADEPSGNLDPKTGEMIYDLLLELRERSRQTIVVTTHSRDLASRAERVLELKNGVLGPIGSMPRENP